MNAFTLDWINWWNKYGRRSTYKYLGEITNIFYITRCYRCGTNWGEVRYNYTNVETQGTCYYCDRCNELFDMHTEQFPLISEEEKSWLFLTGT